MPLQLDINCYRAQLTMQMPRLYCCSVCDLLSPVELVFAMRPGSLRPLKKLTVSACTRVIGIFEVT